MKTEGGTENPKRTSQKVDRIDAEVFFYKSLLYSMIPSLVYSGASTDPPGRDRPRVLSNYRSSSN
jgi:hypothetical protein